MPPGLKRVPLGLKVVRSALGCRHWFLAAPARLGWARGGRALGGNLPGGTGEAGFAAFEELEPDLAASSVADRIQM